MRRLITFFALVIVALITLTACASEAPTQAQIPPPPPMRTAPRPGQGTGFAPQATAPEPTPAPAASPQPEVIVERTAPDPDLLPQASTSFTPGTFSATVHSFNEAPMTVEVTFGESQITNIVVAEHGDSMYGSGWFWRAYPSVPDQILVRQSTQELDAFTGATVTQDAIVAAVEDAITQAGAKPGDLVPVTMTAPLPGDRFMPGFHVITVPANTLDVYGNALAGDAMRMLYSETDDMTLRVSFGRNDFHLHTGGMRGLGQGEAGHGESVYPNEIQGGTWGGWWFRQVANLQVNERQSTHIDTVTGATMSAAAIVWGVEQAMIAAGADPATMTPRANSPIRIHPNPANPDARLFVPGIYSVSARGFGGYIHMDVTLDRTTIRRIVITEHRETQSYWDMVWPGVRDMIYQEQTTHGLDIDTFSGATMSASAVIHGVRSAMINAGEDNPDNQ